MSESERWSPEELQQAHQVVDELMRDRDNGITSIMIDNNANALKIGLSSIDTDASHGRVEHLLASAGLDGVASFFVSGGLAFDQ